MHDQGIRSRRAGAARRYAPKTKTGCLTCKIRRVKCDETKPACNRCTSTQRKCDGYLVQNTGEAKSSTKPESLRPSLNIDVSSDALEKRTFDFFRARTVPSVSGYFQDHLWDQTVLQISHSEPAVRYAINALAAQHEENVLRRTAQRKERKGLATNSDFRTSFPAVQYSKALTSVSKLLTSEQVPMNVVLICSLAFIHFEALRQGFVPALVHTENAIRLLQSSASFNSSEVDPTIVRALMRVDVQGAMYLGMRVPGLSFYFSSTDNTLPSALSDLTQARDLVNTWSARMYHFMRSGADDWKFREPGAAPLEQLAKSLELADIFVILDSLLLEFMNRPNIRLAAREQHGLNMLRCRAKVDRVLSACCLYTEASIYDRYMDDFEDVLAICKYTLTSDDVDQRLFTVSLDEGLLYPLWFVATHCRDSRLRHSALNMLQKLPTGRNVWHVEAMTRSAELCVQYEEAGCDKECPRCEDIPEWKRIYSAGLDGLEVSSANKRVTAYLRTRPNGMDGEWMDVQHTIEITDGITSYTSVDQQEPVDASKFSLLGPGIEPGANFGSLQGHTGHWGPRDPLRLWLLCTEPAKLLEMEGKLGRPKNLPYYERTRSIGSSCL